MHRMTFTPDDEDDYFARRDELVQDFATWLHGKQVPQFANAEDFGTLLDWKWGYGDGRLDTWRLGDIKEFLLTWCPRKIVAPAELMRGIPATVTLAMSFLAERGLRSTSSAPLERLTALPMELQQDFMAAMDDPANFGMGKSLLGGLDIEDLSSLDPAHLDAAIQAYNALPYEERLRLTGGDNDSAPPLPALGPILLPAEPAVRASAESAPVLKKFEQLNDYFAAPGKQLTAAGNLKLADAKALTELLSTGDVAEQEIGDRVWRKHSATKFVHLDHWQWWARTAGVLQRRGNKLVGVKAWRQRLIKDPVAEVVKAFDVLIDYAPLASFKPWLHNPLIQFIDGSVGPLMARLLENPKPTEYDELLDAWALMRSQIGVAEYYPGDLATSFDDLLTLLERAGVITQAGEVRVPREYFGSTRSGGTVELTPVGIVLAVDLLLAQDITVDILPEPESLDATGLAALAVDSGLDLVAWWDFTVSWLGSQPDESVAIRTLLTALNDNDLVLLMIALEAMPKTVSDRAVPILRAFALSSEPPPGERGSAATIFLLKSGVLTEQEIDPEYRMDALLVTLGALAEAEISIVPEFTGGDEDVLALIAEAGRRLPPRIVSLLESIAAEHPSKVVAKAARKELFRVRSRA